MYTLISVLRPQLILLCIYMYYIVYKLILFSRFSQDEKDTRVIKLKKPVGTQHLGVVKTGGQHRGKAKMSIKSSCTERLVLVVGLLLSQVSGSTGQVYTQPEQIHLSYGGNCTKYIWFNPSCMCHAQHSLFLMPRTAYAEPVFGGSGRSTPTV